MRTIPLVDLKTEYEWVREEVLQQIHAALDGMEICLGENVYQFENEFASYCGVRHAVGVGSGTEALNLILRALDIGPGDEVITASHTFIATAEAIALSGARPVFVDIDPVTYTIDPDRLERAVTARTRAIMPVHLYGHPADNDPIMDVAHRHNLRLIEDACQAHGSEYKGIRAGAHGDAAAFSFYCSKNLGAYGDGGMVVTDNHDLATTIRLLRNHGRASKNQHVLVGTTSRLDEIQAAVLRVKLARLDQWNGMRRARAAEYSRGLADLADVETPLEKTYAYHNHHLYVIRTARRDALHSWLQKQGISAAVHYPVPIHLQEPFAHWGDGPGSLPQTERAAREVLSLPMYPGLTLDQISYICQAVRDFFRPRDKAPVRRSKRARAGRR